MAIIKHEIELYNCIPQITDLMPIDLLTMTHSNHIDLLRAHIWECKIFVLNPMLKMIRKSQSGIAILR